MFEKEAKECIVCIAQISAAAMASGARLFRRQFLKAMRSVRIIVRSSTFAALTLMTE